MNQFIMNLLGIGAAGLLIIAVIRVWRRRTLRHIRRGFRCAWTVCKAEATMRSEAAAAWEHVREIDALWTAIGEEQFVYEEDWEEQVDDELLAELEACDPVEEEWCQLDDAEDEASENLGLIQGEDLEDEQERVEWGMQVRELQAAKRELVGEVDAAIPEDEASGDEDDEDGENWRPSVPSDSVESVHWDAEWPGVIPDQLAELAAEVVEVSHLPHVCPDRVVTRLWSEREAELLRDQQRAESLRELAATGWDVSPPPVRRRESRGASAWRRGWRAGIVRFQAFTERCRANAGRIGEADRLQELSNEAARMRECHLDSELTRLNAAVEKAGHAWGVRKDEMAVAKAIATSSVHSHIADPALRVLSLSGLRHELQAYVDWLPEPSVRMALGIPFTSNGETSFRIHALQEGVGRRLELLRQSARKAWHRKSQAVGRFRRTEYLAQRRSGSSHEQAVAAVMDADQRRLQAEEIAARRWIAGWDLEMVRRERRTSAFTEAGLEPPDDVNGKIRLAQLDAWARLWERICRMQAPPRKS